MKSKVSLLTFYGNGSLFFLITMVQCMQNVKLLYFNIDRVIKRVIHNKILEGI